MKTRYSILLALALLFSGCNKEEDDYISKYCPGSCTEVSGQVLRANGQPMASVMLSANWMNLRHFKEGGTGMIRRKAVAYTDSQGRYTLRFLVRDDEMLDGHMEVALQGNLCEQVACERYTLYSHELKRDTTYTYDFKLN